MAETAIQLLLAGLLALTVAWCALVHQRLTRLRTDRGEMETFLTSLTQMTDRAEVAIAALRGVGETLGQDLARNEQAARRTLDQLSRVAEAASRLTRRLDPLLQQAIGQETGGQPARSRAPARDVAAVEGAASTAPLQREGQTGRSRVTPELLRVLQGLR